MAKSRTNSAALWSVEKLVPYANNPRTHSDAQIAQIAESIEEFGFTNPILVDTKAGILAGHGRLRAAQKLGLAKVPVLVLDHLTETQKRAYLLADNRLAENAGWDEELLAAELEALKLEEYDLALTGFSEKELDELLGATPIVAPEPQIDRADELQRKWKTERGQLWLIGEHRLLCGDSTAEADVTRLMNGKRGVLFATDPP
jgi:ParB/RepB/Spo0J family partition protein